MRPTIGRIVQYRLRSTDAEAISRRRANPTVYNQGNAVRAGDVVAMTVTTDGIVVPPAPGSEDAKLLAGEAGPGGAYAASDPVYEINGQATLDGNDAHWVTSATGPGTEEGQWNWPPRQR